MNKVTLTHPDVDGEVSVPAGSVASLQRKGWCVPLVAFKPTEMVAPIAPANPGDAPEGFAPNPTEEA